MSLGEGLLDLRLGVGADGRTRLVERAQRFPLRMTVPLYPDPADPGMAFVYVQNPTGGVFAGDELSIKVVAGERARVHLTTTSATKLCRMETGRALQRVQLVVEAGAYLESIPEPLIPQAGARYEQRVVVEVGEGASFVGAETVAPGRIAHGESFAYEQLRLSTQIRDTTGSELAAETILLEPGRRNPASRGLLGSYAYACSLFAVVPRGAHPGLAELIDERIRDLSDVLAAAGALPSERGAFARVLARSATAAQAAVAAGWHAARQAVIGAPPPRRRK